MKITIYQPKKPTFLVKKDQTFSKADYKKVFESTTTAMFGNPGIEHKICLEMLFERFNMGHYPTDYKGHSLSVGDIVVLDNFIYVCANFGWKKIQWEKQ